MVRWLALRTRTDRKCRRPECSASSVFLICLEKLKVQARPVAMSHVGNPVRSSSTLFQQISPAYVDRTASSTPTLLRQRMCASRQSDRCLEAMMLQLQCNYYNGNRAGRSNASGRQSKSRHSSNYGREAAKDQFSTGFVDPKDGCPAVTPDTRMCPNQRLWRITDRMILT